MSNQPVFWRMRNGKLVSVDDMDINHIKNAFKHLIKHHQKVVDKYNALVEKRKAERDKASFSLNGDIAQLFNDDREQYEMEMEVGITDIETGIL